MKRHRSWVIGDGNSVRVVGHRWVRDGNCIHTSNVEAQNLRVDNALSSFTDFWAASNVATVSSDTNPIAPT